MLSLAPPLALRHRQGSFPAAGSHTRSAVAPSLACLAASTGLLLLSPSNKIHVPIYISSFMTGIAWSGLDNPVGNALGKGEPSPLLLNFRLFPSFNHLFKLPTVSASSIHHISDSYYLRLSSEYFDSPQETHTVQDGTTVPQQSPTRKKHRPLSETNCLPPKWQSHPFGRYQYSGRWMFVHNQRTLSISLRGQLPKPRGNQLDLPIV